nr:LCCL domain-containing protein [uncultured Sphaerochaeta sp.]
MDKFMRIGVGVVVFSLLFLGCTSASLSFSNGIPEIQLGYDHGAFFEALNYVPNVEPWLMSGDMFSERVGDIFTLELPPGGSDFAIWGTGVYTGDSNVGTAAVHSGLITFEEGGRVYFKILEGRTYYRGSTQKGVTSITYGSWPLSFVFTDKKGNLLEEGILGEYVIDWHTNADFLNLSVGEAVTVSLPPGGTEEIIWGSGPYSSDSPIGTAAVHAGKISFEEGGEVTIRFMEEVPRFNGSTRHGVTSEYFSDPLEAYIFL